MNKYEITITAHYEKTITVFADSPKQAREKMKIILFDTDLVDFNDEDFVCGEAVINDANENDCEKTESEDCDEEGCSGCAYLCPVCGCCMCGEEDED